MKTVCVFMGVLLLICHTLTMEKGTSTANPYMSLTMCLAQISGMNEEYNLRTTEITSGYQRTQKISSYEADNTICPTGDRVFRTADGLCNNVNNPNLGRSFERFKRYIAPRYSEGFCIPRLWGVDGGQLPSCRIVSTTIHPPVNVNSMFSIMLMQLGQFIDHDLNAAAITQPSTSNECCSNPTAAAGNLHPDSGMCGEDVSCLTISIPEGDGQFTSRCQEFFRSRSIDPIESLNPMNPREQQNLLTAFLDASNVYGSDLETQERLRVSGPNNNGLMKTTPGNIGDLLPEGRPEDCILDSAPFCFAAGDERVHVFPGLTGLHTVFVRLHNFIATQLARHTNLCNEDLFQETKKIISALMQQIVYREWLPEILAPEIIEQFQLRDVPFTYDPSIDPSISAVFATAAFRFGHSLIPDSLEFGRDANGNRAFIPSRNLFNNPELIHRNIRRVMAGILCNPGKNSDRFMTEEISNHLFERDNIGFDLLAFNCQRGRDHGLPPYKMVREDLCNLTEFTSFLNDPLLGANSILFGDIYDDVRDVDLFAGGMSELPLTGSILGPTFSCILGMQFRDLKFGDSFWYETTDPSRGFTPDQLSSIKEVSFSRILCKTLGLWRIQPNPFKLPLQSFSNLRVRCSSLPGFDLTPWYGY